MTGPETRPDVDVCPRCADGGSTIPVTAHDRDDNVFSHRCPVCRHEWTVRRTPQELTPPRSYQALYRAQSALTHATYDLEQWHAGRPGETDRNYVTAGVEATGRIDEVLAALQEARAALISERRRDEDLRALCVDAMLAARRSPNSATAPGDPAPEADQQAHTNP
ncbi:MAG: hypothetical protein ACRDP6_37240 [Actinoallomurus sp.]